MKLLSTILLSIFSVLCFSQEEKNFSLAPNVFILDSSCYDFDYKALDIKLPLNYYGSTSCNDIYKDFMFYPNERYANFYNVENKYVNGVLCRAKWTRVTYGSQALIANYFLCEFVTISVYEYHYFEWVPVK